MQKQLIKKESCIQWLDANNLYGWAGGFNWAED